MRTPRSSRAGGGPSPTTAYCAGDCLPAGGNGRAGRAVIHVAAARFLPCMWRKARVQWGIGRSGDYGTHHHRLHEPCPRGRLFECPALAAPRPPCCTRWPPAIRSTRPLHLLTPTPSRRVSVAGMSAGRVCVFVSAFVKMVRSERDAWNQAQRNAWSRITGNEDPNQKPRHHCSVSLESLRLRNRHPCTHTCMHPRTRVLAT